MVSLLFSDSLMAVTFKVTTDPAGITTRPERSFTSLAIVAATVSPTVRMYRNGSLPIIGKAAVEALQANALGSSWQPAHARVSASGDFGYTTGMISMGAAPTPGSQGQPQYYVRVWRKDKSGAWKVELDIVV